MAQTYRYEDVPEAVYRALLAAPSKGRFVHAVIRAGGTDSAYAYAPVPGPPPHVVMTPVASSNVAAVGYEPDFRRLWLTFDPR